LPEEKARPSGALATVKQAVADVQQWGQKRAEKNPKGRRSEREKKLAKDYETKRQRAIAQDRYSRQKGQ